MSAQHGLACFSVNTLSVFIYFSFTIIVVKEQNTSVEVFVQLYSFFSFSVRGLFRFIIAQLAAVIGCSPMIFPYEIVRQKVNNERYALLSQLFEILFLSKFCILTGN